jgi:hypothetical protein
MILVNGVVALGVLAVLFAVFDVRPILAARLEAIPLVRAAAHWNLLWPMLPGGAVGFACLWYWLAFMGRARGVTWGGALLYGGAIAFGNVPLSAFLVGLLHGNPVLALVLALVSLLNLLQPSFTLAMAVFGLTMGAFNGALAHAWIERHRPR